MTLTELTSIIAKRTGTSQDQVSLFIKCFCEETLKSLIKGDSVKLVGFGTFIPKDPLPKMAFGKLSKPKRTVRFRVAKTVQFPLSRRHNMEKLGVVIDEEKVKVATGRINTSDPNISNTPKAVCPNCLRSLTEPYKCDVCGTEPFEKRP